MTRFLVKDLVKTNVSCYNKSDNWEYINYLDTGNLTNNVISEVVKLIPGEDTIPSRAKRKVKQGDILYSTVRPNQCHFGYMKNLLDNMLVSTGYAVLEPLSDKVCGKYLYYYLTQREIVEYLHSIAEGTVSTYPSIQPKDIEKISIDMPDLDEQKAIASVLSTYDDLIEKNNRKIEILQEMAEELYKEWFVRFRFPGYKTIGMKNSILGKIPDNFNTAKMTDIFDDYIGGGWGNDNENVQYCVPAYVIRGTDFPSVAKSDTSTCPYRWHKKSNYRSRQLKPNDIVIEISGGTAEQPVGRAVLVDESLIKQFENKVICASFCKQVTLKQDIISPIYFYYWMKFLYDTRMIDRFQLQSTGIINFKFEYFVRKGDVLLPPKQLMKKFNDIVATMRENVSKLAQQNNLLKQQRDLLLPRLMSGKLEVS